MQTSNRDNLGRNNYWTPSNISLTQSLINEAINEINSKISYINEILNLKADEIDVVNEISSINNNLDLKANKLEVNNEISNLNVELAKKADLIETNNKLDLKSDLTYVDSNISTLNSNISSINNNLDLKANKLEVDNEISNLNVELRKKADATNIYNKTETYNKIEIDDSLLLKANTVDVDSGLAKKADLLETNNKLLLKSDLSYVDSNISTLNSSIQLKANTIDVDNKLLLKSDLDYVNSNISSINNNLDLKANTIDVDNKLSEKADLLETNNKLDLKANLSDVYVKNDIDNKVSTINSEINLKANTNDVYNKTEIDEKLSNFNPSASVYTKEEIDEKLLDYPKKDTVFDKDYINRYYYRQAQVDAIFMSKDRNLIIAREQPSDVTTYTSLASQELLAEKANVDDVYNKSEIDSKISTINSNIDLKANTSDVYNKTECDSRYIAVGSISKNMEVYSRINLVKILDPLVSTKTSFTAYSSQRLFTITIPAESNVSLPENNGITLWHLKFVLFITSTTTDKERLKELMMNLRLSVYINNAHHELSVKPQYYNDLTRYYLDSTFILNSLPTSDETLYIDGYTSISMNDLEIEFRNIYPYTNYIYRFGLST